MTELVTLNQLISKRSKTEYYNIKDFFDSRKVRQSLKTIKPSNEYEKELIKILSKNIDKVKKFLKNSENGVLFKQTVVALPNDNDNFFEIVETYQEKIHTKKAIGTFIKPDKINDVEKLIDQLPTKELFAIVDLQQYALNEIKNKSIPLSVAGSETMIDSLLKECGIEPKGSGIFKWKVGEKVNDQIFKKDIDITVTHFIVRNLIGRTLYNIKKIKEKELANKRTVVNIKNPKEHSFIGKPSTTGFLDMVKGSLDKRDIKNLAREYRKEVYTSDEIKKDGGFLAHMDENDIKQLPLIMDDELDPKIRTNFIANMTAQIIDSILALQCYLKDNPNDDGYIEIKELAKYIPQYENKIKKDGYLRKRDRDRIYNGLYLAQLVSTDYIVGKTKKGNIQWKKIYLLDRITDYETNKKGDIIRLKVNFSDDYIKALNYNLGVILDKVVELTQTETKLLATYISDRLVSKQNQTVKGEPTVFTAKTLCNYANINDDNITNRYKTLTKALNLLVDQKIIEKWETKNGNQRITTRIKDSESILIYPTNKIINSYITKEQSKAQRKAEKIQQTARVKTLTKVAKGYTKLDTLAKNLNISRAELDEMLTGQMIINDDILDKINSL